MFGYLGKVRGIQVTEERFSVEVLLHFLFFFPRFNFFLTFASTIRIVGLSILY